MNVYTYPSEVNRIKYLVVSITTCPLDGVTLIAFFSGVLSAYRAGHRLAELSKVTYIFGQSSYCVRVVMRMCLAIKSSTRTRQHASLYCIQIAMRLLVRSVFMCVCVCVCVCVRARVRMLPHGWMLQSFSVRIQACLFFLRVCMYMAVK